MKSATLIAFAGACLLAPIAGAQDKTPAEKPAVQAHIDNARRLGGTRYAETVAHQCAGQGRGAPAGVDTLQLGPARIFDNLYYVGLGRVGAWALDTSDGIVLFDTLNNSKDAEDTIAGGLVKLGLDPKRIKYLVITHAHNDHFGGAVYLQQHYGARSIASDIDWKGMEDFKPTRPDRFDPPPKRDIVVGDGQKMTVGDATLTFVLTPGHTPGTLSVIFNVKDHGQPHTMVLLGGTTPPPDLASQREILASLRHLTEFTTPAGADAEISNHPYLDASIPLIQGAGQRRAGDPNPFVIGQTGFKNFIGLLSECFEANVARLAG